MLRLIINIIELGVIIFLGVMFVMRERKLRDLTEDVECKQQMLIASNAALSEYRLRASAAEGKEYTIRKKYKKLKKKFSTEYASYFIAAKSKEYKAYLTFTKAPENIPLAKGKRKIRL